MIQTAKIEDLSALVEKHAKYQKVMLLFDQYTSNAQIANIYDTIKGLCIFNKIDIQNSAISQTQQENKINEIYNGYKMLIFLCTPENFAKSNLNLEEFINVFVCQNAFLPYCLGKNHTLSQAHTILLQTDNKLDKPAFSSLSFNNFYNYVLDIYTQVETNFDINMHEFSNNNLLSILSNLSANFKFVDIEILATTDFDYRALPIIDFVLLAGFEAFFAGVKQHSFLLADIYKVGKNNPQLINKYYSLSQNDAIITMVELNFNFLQNKLNAAKQIVHQFLQIIPTDDMFKIINAVKNFSKNSSGILNYLYLYNVFETWFKIFKIVQSKNYCCWFFKMLK